GRLPSTGTLFSPPVGKPRSTGAAPVPGRAAGRATVRTRRTLAVEPAQDVGFEACAAAFETCVVIGVACRGAALGDFDSGCILPGGTVAGGVTALTTLVVTLVALFSTWPIGSPGTLPSARVTEPGSSPGCPTTTFWSAGVPDDGVPWALATPVPMATNPPATR